MNDLREGIPKGHGSSPLTPTSDTWKHTVGWVTTDMLGFETIFSKDTVQTIDRVTKVTRCDDKTWDITFERWTMVQDGIKSKSLTKDSGWTHSSTNINAYPRDAWDSSGQFYYRLTDSTVPLPTV